MNISTDALDSKGFFDPRYTCDFDNSSPELRWSESPEGTGGFALIAEDPDAPKGLFTHWVVYNIPVNIHHLPAGVPPQESLPNGIRQGLNSFGKLGYSGPCPPTDHGTHRYYFRVYALRFLPEISNRATREEVLQAITPLILSTAEFVGYYSRMAQQKAG